MGIFDRFRERPINPQQVAELPPLLKKNIAHVFPNGRGRFGWDKENPVPCALIWDNGADRYLGWMKWKGMPISAVRTGSVGVPGFPGMIDRYALTAGDKPIGTIHLCPYARENSLRFPKGLSVSEAYMKDTQIAVVLAATNKVRQDYLKRLALCLIDSIGKDRANALDVDWAQFPILTAYFDSTKDQHGDVITCFQRMFPSVFSAQEMMRFAEIAAIPPDDLSHPSVPKPSG